MHFPHMFNLELKSLHNHLGPSHCPGISSSSCCTHATILARGRTPLRAMCLSFHFFVVLPGREDLLSSMLNRAGSDRRHFSFHPALHHLVQAPPPFSLPSVMKRLKSDISCFSVFERCAGTCSTWNLLATTLVLHMSIASSCFLLLLPHLTHRYLLVATHHSLGCFFTSPYLYMNKQLFF